MSEWHREKMRQMGMSEDEINEVLYRSDRGEIAAKLIELAETPNIDKANKDAQDKIAKRINGLAGYVHMIAVANGWYDTERELPELIALFHTEVSECLDGQDPKPIGFSDELVQIHKRLSNLLEAARDGKKPDSHLPRFSNVDIEMADLIIRALDACAYLKIDIGNALVAKIEYNKTRGYRHGGKKY